MVGIPSLDDTFSGIVGLEASPVEAFEYTGINLAHIHAKIAGADPGFFLGGGASLTTKG